jgi:CBS domain-containing protein
MDKLQFLQYDGSASMECSLEEFLDRRGVKNPDVFSPEVDIIDALKIMNTKCYSQVPVCDEAKHLIGYISWDVIFKNICLNNGTISGAVGDFMSTNLDKLIISFNTPLREALGRINEVEFLIIVDDITGLNVRGLVTVADLSDNYSLVMQGYILIREIEHRLREIIFKAEVTYSDARSLTKREDVDSIDKLTIGNICFMLNNPCVWQRTSMCDYYDQGAFHEMLSQVCLIRNKIMHMNWPADGAEADEDLSTLKKFLGRL